MPLVKCSASTCIHNKNGMCGAEAIEMENFEYYADKENKEHDVLSDEMKCTTYKSIYRSDKNEFSK